MRGGANAREGVGNVPAPFGNDAVQPSLEEGEPSLSGLNANLRTLCQAARLAYCIARDPAPAAQIICKAGLDATEADDVRETLALGRSHRTSRPCSQVSTNYSRGRNERANNHRAAAGVVAGTRLTCSRPRKNLWSRTWTHVAIATRQDGGGERHTQGAQRTVMMLGSLKRHGG
jgi:hypothetical protein